MYGADADQLERLALDLEHLGDAFRRTEQEVTRSLASAPWHGASAERFRSRWSTEFSRALRTAHTVLHDSGTVLRANARAQREASDGGSPWGRGFRSCAANRPDGGGRPRRSLWDRWLGREFDDEFILALKGIRTVVSFSKFGFQKWLVSRGLVTNVGTAAKPMGSLVGPLAIIVGGITMWQAGSDFLNDHPYSGNFAHAESLADGLSFVSGGLAVAGGILLFTPAAPVGAAVLAASAVVGLTGLGIDLGLKAWDEWGGRELWNSRVAPALSRTWDSAVEVASGAVSDVRSAASSTWRNATDLVGGASQRFSDAGSALKNLASKAVSWL